MLLKMLTFLPLSTIEETMKKQQEIPEKRIAQNILADSITQMLFGK